MSSSFDHGSGRRKRVSGALHNGARGLSITTDDGDLWVIDQDQVDPELLGRRVTVEGTLAGLDRLNVDWIGEAH